MTTHAATSTHHDTPRPSARQLRRRGRRAAWTANQTKAAIAVLLHIQHDYEEARKRMDSLCDRMVNMARLPGLDDAMRTAIAEIVAPLEAAAKQRAQSADGACSARASAVGAEIVPSRRSPAVHG